MSARELRPKKVAKTLAVAKKQEVIKKAAQERKFMEIIPLWSADSEEESDSADHPAGSKEQETQQHITSYQVLQELKEQRSTVVHAYLKEESIKTTKTEVITTRIRETLFEQVKHAAYQHGITIREFIEGALENHLSVQSLLTGIDYTKKCKQPKAGRPSKEKRSANKQVLTMINNRGNTELLYTTSTNRTKRNVKKNISKKGS